MELLIAIPAFDTMQTEFVKSLLDLSTKLTEEKITYETKILSGTLLYIARDKLAKYAIEKAFTHVLWLDSDMVFEPTIFEDLSFSGKAFVTGIACSRRRPFSSCLFKKYSPKAERWKHEEYPKETFEVAACGFGAVLTKIEVLKTIMQRWGTCFTPSQSYGEDVAFCDRAKKAGYKVYAEPCVQVGHIARIAVYPYDVAGEDLKDIL